MLRESTVSEIFVVAPAKIVTGGPELCHQLVDTLNRDSKRARIVYYPFTQHHETPSPYRRYNVYPAGFEDIRSGSTVVLPEVYGELVAEFSESSQVYFWWMSVRNFFRREGSAALGQLDVVRRYVTRHLYQSDYARRFLEFQSIGPASRVSDYLASEYLESVPQESPRENIVVCNPAKGMDRTQSIVRTLNKRIGEKPRIVAVNRMDRDQVRTLLGRAKVYIDFGDHPGKDRLPREAAAMGCCVLTNRRGAASNSTDMPIPVEFKIDDRMPGWEGRAANKIHLLISQFDRQAPRFDTYRQMIAQEPVDFADDIDAVFADSYHA